MICPNAYNKFLGTVIDYVDRKKLEFYIGNLLIGKEKNVPKYIVLYGGAGTGKSTILCILQWIFKEQTCVLADSIMETYDYLKIVNPDIVLINDGDVEKTIKELEKDPDITLHSRFIFATNKLPDPFLPVTTLCMSGKTFLKEEYYRLRSCMEYLIDEFASYCVDSLIV